MFDQCNKCAYSANGSCVFGNQCTDGDMFCREINICSYHDLLSVTAEEITVWLYKHYSIELPECLDTPEEMMMVRPIISRLGNAYSFISFLHSQAKSMARTLKKKDKTKYEEMMGIRDALDETLKTIQFQYGALSRMVTIRKEEKEEQERT